MSELDALVAEHRAPRRRRVSWLIMLVLVTFIVWANVARLDEVTIAQGEVVPQGQVKLIQHLEGGIIKSIAVREGDVVMAGDTLVQLDLPVSVISPEEIEVRLGGLALTRARLQALIHDRQLNFPEQEVRRLPEVV